MGLRYYARHDVGRNPVDHRPQGASPFRKFAKGAGAAVIGTGAGTLAASSDFGPGSSLSGLLVGSHPRSAEASAVPCREDYGPADTGEAGDLVRRFCDYLGLRRIDGTSSTPAAAVVAALAAVLVLVLLWRLVF